MNFILNKKPQDMERSKTIFTIICCLLFILFAFAAMTKLWEQGKFYTTLLNSPILHLPQWGIEIIAWLIPIMEAITAIGLITAKYKLQALCLATFLLAGYLLYVLGILFIAPYRPCSCGGVVALIDWQQHLYVLVTALALSTTGIYFYYKLSKN